MIVRPTWIDRTWVNWVTTLSCCARHPFPSFFQCWPRYCTNPPKSCLQTTLEWRMGGTRAVWPATLSVLDCTLGYNTSQASKKKKQQTSSIRITAVYVLYSWGIAVGNVRTVNCLVGVRTTENWLGQEAVTISQGSH